MLVWNSPLGGFRVGRMVGNPVYPVFENSEARLINFRKLASPSAKRQPFLGCGIIQ